MRKSVLALTALASAGLIVFGAGHLAQASDPQQPTPKAVEKQAAEVQVETKVCVLPAESFAGKTIAEWRAEGPEGLAALMEKLKPTIEAYRAAKAPTQPFVQSKSELPASDLANILLLEQVAQQRDAHASGLYWYTDLDAAIEQAKRTGKPILSLRMLGKLVDEYSCANSRFFRTVLYADESVGEMLRDEFVLHWESVRPVPVITIDMGDGRTLKRTITGNSAHYILDPNGRVVDCLPGLYASGTFERFVGESGNFAKQLVDVDDAKFTQLVKAVHQERAAKLDRAWGQYMQVIDQENKAGEQKVDVREIALNDRNPKRGKMPDAREAGRIAIEGKFRIERPLVNAVLPEGAPTAQQAAEDAALWERVAEAYAKEAEMDAGSRALMAAKAPKESVESAMKRAFSKSVVESPLVRMVRNFQGGVAIETARNEHLLRRQLHDWFVNAKAPLDLSQLNKRVYAKLFLTPDEDPWLGLVPADTYSALDGGGLIELNDQASLR